MIYVTYDFSLRSLQCTFAVYSMHVHFPFKNKVREYGFLHFSTAAMKTLLFFLPLLWIMKDYVHAKPCEYVVRANVFVLLGQFTPMTETSNQKVILFGVWAQVIGHSLCVTENDQKKLSMLQKVCKKKNKKKSPISEQRPDSSYFIRSA